MIGWSVERCTACGRADVELADGRRWPLGRIEGDEVAALMSALRTVYPLDKTGNGG